MSDVELTRRARDGVVRPTGSSGRRGRGGSRSYTAADLAALDALAALRALGIPLAVAKPIINTLQQLPGWQGRRREPGEVYLDYEDFPECLYFNGREVSETEPSEVGAIVLRVRPCVALQMARSIILWEEPFLRFERLMCLSRRDDYLGELAQSKLVRAVFGISDEARDLATFLGFENGSREADLIVALCTEHLAEFEKHLEEEEKRENAQEIDGGTESNEASTPVDASGGSDIARWGSPKDAIDRNMSGEKTSVWVGNPTEFITDAEELGYEVDPLQVEQTPEHKADGVHLCVVAGRAAESPEGEDDWIVGVITKVAQGEPAPWLGRCDWCGNFGHAGANAMR